MKWLIFLFFLVTQLRGQEFEQDEIIRTTTTSSTTTTTSTTAAPQVIIHINSTQTNSVQAPSPTSEIVPANNVNNVSIISEVVTANATDVAGNETITTIVVPITIVIPELANTTLNQDPNINETAVEPADSKAVGIEMSNQTIPKINEIPTLIIVDIISEVEKSNATQTTTTTTTTPTPTSSSEVNQYPLLDGDQLNQAAINHILSQNVSENLVEDFDEIDSWEPPLKLQRAFPYYLTGFDEENRPIWVSEWGKFDLRKIVLGGNKSIEEFNKYARKAVRIITKSHDLKATPENPVTQAAFIVDFDGLKLDQYAHLPTVMYALDLAREHRDIIEKHASRVVIVNTNFIAEAAINLGRNVFGRLFERVEVFGVNKSRWVHHLRRIFPADQIPEWYGGTKRTHKPLFIYGK